MVNYRRAEVALSGGGRPKSANSEFPSHFLKKTVFVMVPCFVTCNFPLRFTMKTSDDRNRTDSRDPPRNPPHSEFPSHFLKKSVFVTVSFFVKCNFAMHRVFPSSVFFEKGFVIRNPRRSRQIRQLGISFAFFEKKRVCDCFIFVKRHFALRFTMKMSDEQNPTYPRDPRRNPPIRIMIGKLEKSVFVMVSFFVKCNFALRRVFPSSVFFQKGVLLEIRESRGESAYSGFSSHFL